jgi:hypothetical protein
MAAQEACRLGGTPLVGDGRSADAERLRAAPWLPSTSLGAPSSSAEAARSEARLSSPPPGGM